MKKEKTHLYGHFNIAWQNKLLLNKKINLYQSCSLVFPDVLYPSLDAVPTSCLCPVWWTSASSNQDGQVPPHQASSPGRGLQIEPEQDWTIIQWHKEMQASVSWSLL